MKIGFSGLGIMGESMCENVICKHDDTVYVFDLVKEKMEKLAADGAIVCSSNYELAQNCDIFISMVPKSEHSEAVYQEILPALHRGKICIDMSTIDPKVSRDIAARVKAAGAEFVDAPVVKSKPAAVEGKLGIYVGGSQQAFERVLPILSYMGENIIHMGDNGSGLVMKICHNALVSQIQNGVNETVALAHAYGIDVMTFAQAVSYGGGQNFYLDSKKKVIAENDFTTAFSVANMHKDVHICMQMAEEMNISMPGEANVTKVYDKAMEDGYGNLDFSSTIQVVKHE